MISSRQPAEKVPGVSLSSSLAVSLSVCPTSLHLSPFLLLSRSLSVSVSLSCLLSLSLSYFSFCSFTVSLFLSLALSVSFSLYCSSLCSLPPSHPSNSRKSKALFLREVLFKSLCTFILVFHLFEIKLNGVSESELKYRGPYTCCTG